MVYQKVADLLNKADALVIAAGAGMGVDSGLPDFRGNQGFWKAYPPYAEKGLSFVDMANPGWFSRDPEFAWGFYGHRMNLYRQTTPHRGFDILLKWGQRMRQGFFVFTSNVDGQFQKAGFPDSQILEVHGSIHHMQCLNNCDMPIFKADNYSVEVDESTMLAQPPLPHCPQCQSLARPNILMFGDWGWDSSREAQQSHRYLNWLSKIKNDKLLVIECGAGSAVPTVRFQSEQLADRQDATVVRINVREPVIALPNISIPEPAGETLSRIDEILS